MTEHTPDLSMQAHQEAMQKRALAIHEVLGMAISIEGEWGGSDEVKAHAEGTKVLLALGVSPSEIPQLVHPSYSETSYVLPDPPGPGWDHDYWSVR